MQTVMKHNLSYFPGITPMLNNNKQIGVTQRKCVSNERLSGDFTCD